MKSEVDHFILRDTRYNLMLIDRGCMLIKCNSEESEVYRFIVHRETRDII